MNRTIRLQKRLAGSGRSDPDAIGRLIEAENFLAENTRTLADAYEQMTGIDMTCLRQAETAMLGASASLARPDFDDAVNLEKDALTFLIKARDDVRRAVTDPKKGQQAREFSRKMAQKLRRPKKDKEDEAEELAERLRKMAEQEELVVAKLDGSNSTP